MRPPPTTPIPRVGSSISGDAQVMEDIEDDLGRTDRRKRYLSSLWGLVPELSHPTQVQASSSGHFSLLQVRERQDKMPFLNEVFEHVSQNPSHTKTDFNGRVSQWYPTTEPAESTIFKHRSVPRVLRQFITPNQCLKVVLLASLLASNQIR